MDVSKIWSQAEIKLKMLRRQYAHTYPAPARRTTIKSGPLSESAFPYTY